MKLRRAVATGLFPVLMLGGCAFGAPPPPIEDTRLVAGSPQQALDRADRYLRARGFTIDKAYRRGDRGRVSASKSEFDSGDYARCAWSFVMSGGAVPAADVDVFATQERPGWTRVRAAVDISLVNRFGDRAECASHGKLEREILAAASGGG